MPMTSKIKTLKTNYLECICFDLNHITRITYDTEYSEFYFEYRIHVFPGERSTTTINNKFDYLKHYFKCFKVYLKNLWWALKGHPSWYTADSTLSSEEAKKLVNFINKNLKKKIK